MFLRKIKERLDRLEDQLDWKVKPKIELLGANVGKVEQKIHTLEDLQLSNLEYAVRIIERDLNGILNYLNIVRDEDPSTKFKNKAGSAL